MASSPINHRNYPSDEATQPQLDLARDQGKAFNRALKAMSEMDAHGQLRNVEDYLVGYEVESAEGMYFLNDGQLQWNDPQQNNAHLEVVVCDANDGRFIPGLQVHARITDGGDREIISEDLRFLWHPWLYHYGRNIRIPGSGTYKLYVSIEAPDFPRHDRLNGHRYAHPVEVSFDKVTIKAGQKHSPEPP